MAINPLSGNFQSLDVASGQSLPPKTSTAADGLSKSDAVPAQPSNNVAKLKPSDETKAGAPESQRDTKETAAELQQKLDELTQSASNIQRSLRFQVDEFTGSTVIKVFDRKTDELIRQIPSEDMLTLSKRLKELNESESETSTGILIRQEV
ncbi:flagellar protein FlaG [Pleionea litopenaei]|uniref:Flagellar protein FlaG n=1 Tax=Pleionea litopenaei TaxID=3070815 RepID=A0AA51X812_9GAMM|nr:flagellar protein FlaG [Pleionea sp. HL-JVS1]WMS87655.1 flagellar protein FlaG [Pleionea sp. HL-JVS1]